MSRRRRSRGGGGCGCVFSLLIAAAMLAASFYVDARGIRRTATVHAKHETIHIDYAGAWRRTFELGVGPMGDVGLDARVAVGGDRFDRLRVGDTVAVKYAECCAIFARLADRTTLGWLGEWAPTVLWGLRWVVWAVGGVAILFLAYRLGRLPLLAVAAVWALAALALDAATPSRPVATGSTVAVARVREARYVDRITRGRGRSDPIHFRQPFDVVALAFVPARGADTVVAVDAVDAGSAGRLAYDSLTRVRFDPAAPRDAMLVAGTRTHLTRNRPFFVGAAAFLVLGATLVGLLAAPGWVRGASSRD